MRKHDPHRLFFLIKWYAFQTAVTVVFLAALVKLVLHELGLR